MKVNQFTGEVDLNLFAEEPKKLTMSDVRAAAAEIPGKVQDAIGRELAARAFAATMREQSGDRLALKF